MYSKTQKQILREIREQREHSISVCSDPMNGCPEDFAHDFHRQETKLINQAYSVGLEDEDIWKYSKKGADDAELNTARMYGEEFRGFKGLLKWKSLKLYWKMQDRREYRRWKRQNKRQEKLVVLNIDTGKTEKMTVRQFLRKYGW